MATETDREKLVDLLVTFGVEFKDNATGVKVGGWKERQGVVGYVGFYTLFEFDENGKFEQMGAWE